MSEKDSYDIKLEEETANLQNCQASHNLKSCFDCENVIECEVRKNYVSAVYKSMNKGLESDFDF